MQHHDRVRASLEGDVLFLQAQLRQCASADEQKAAQLFRDLVSACVQRGVARQREKHRARGDEGRDRD